MEYRTELQHASGTDVLAWFSSGAQEVTAHMKYLNIINVFPVADGDTGTNLSATIRAMVERSARSFSFGGMLQAISQSGLENARGNSGIIFASYVSGLAQEGAAYEKVSVRDFALIASNAVRHLYNAVEQPCEGTLMSVIRDWAVFLGGNSEKYKNFQELFSAAYREAHRSLENTKNQLAVLRKNNVVDSGAAGFVRFLEGINRALDTGFTVAPVEEEELDVPLAIEEEAPNYRYCTEALIQLNAQSTSGGEAIIANVREVLSPFGDSVIAGLRGDRLKVHIHTNTPAAVMERLQAYGTLIEQKADDMALQNQLRTSEKGGIGLITDSVADLPDAFLLKNNVSVIPMGIFSHGAVFLDKLTLTLPQLFAHIDAQEAYPTSSQPEPARIQTLLAERLEHFDSLLILSVASQLSGTYRALVGAAQALSTPEHPIMVLDTRLNSGAQGLLVHRAAELIARGKTQQQIVADLEARIPRTKIYVCLNTLAYAIRGGRVPNTIGKIGMALGLRPIMTLDAQGHGAAFGAAFSQQGLTRKIMKLVKRAMQNGGIESYSIVHGGNPTLADEYSNQLTQIIGFAPTFVSEISAVVALHAGPGTVAVCFTTTKEE